MLKVSIDKILPVTEARANIARLVNEVEKGNVYVITRGGKPAVAIVPVDEAEQIMPSFNTKKSSANNKSSKQSIAKKVEKKEPIQYEKKTTEVIEKEPEKKEVVNFEQKQEAMQTNQNEDDLSGKIDMDKVNEELAKLEN